MSDLELHCHIGQDIEVFVCYSIDFGGGKPLSYSSPGCKDKAHPSGFILDVPQGEYFNLFRDEVLAIYGKCCLREEYK